MTSSSPAVATTSPSQMCQPVRTWVERWTPASAEHEVGGSPGAGAGDLHHNVDAALARGHFAPNHRNAMTSGLKCAPEMGPIAR